MCLRMAAFIVALLCVGGTFWTHVGSAQSTRSEPAVVLAAYADTTMGEKAEAKPPEMSAWIKSAQARCPPGQLVFLTNACGCNGACCACSAQAPYLDNCSCRCSATPPTTCNRGYSAGRR